MSDPKSSRGGPRRVTLKQVAEEAGVNIATASRVLAGKGEQYRLSEPTIKLVRKVAQALNYQPNQVAKSLRTKQTSLIGVIVPDISNAFFSAVAQEISVCAEEKGFSVMLAISQDITAVEKKVCNEMLNRLIDGLIVCPVGVESTHFSEIHARGCPLVLVDRVFNIEGVSTVTSDHERAAYKLTNLLLKAGHRSIGVLGQSPGTLTSDERIAGYSRALESAGVAFDGSLVRGGGFNEADGYESAASLLRERPEITALFSMSNPAALGALRAAEIAGLSVPRDLSIVTFDEHPCADLLASPLTVAAQDVIKLGRVAVELLLDQIKRGKDCVLEDRRLRVPIIERNSVKHLKAT